MKRRYFARSGRRSAGRRVLLALLAGILVLVAVAAGAMALRGREIARQVIAAVAERAGIPPDQLEVRRIGFDGLSLGAVRIGGAEGPAASAIEIGWTPGSLMRGRVVPLSRPRRFIGDLLHFAAGVPTVPVQRRMALGPVVAARRLAAERPPWTAIFAKAFALVAAEFPEFRRAYCKFPRPHLYEYPVSVAAITVERDYRGEKAVFNVRVKDPAVLPLAELGRLAGVPMPLAIAGGRATVLPDPAGDVQAR